MSPSVNLNRPETLTAWLVQVRDGRVDTLWKARVSTLPMQKTNTGVKHKDERRLEPDPVGGCQSKRRRNKKNQEVQRVRPALPKQNKTLTPDSHPSHPLPSPPQNRQKLTGPPLSGGPATKARCFSIGRSGVYAQSHVYQWAYSGECDERSFLLRAMSINGLTLANCNDRSFGKTREIHGKHGNLLEYLSYASGPVVDDGR